VQKSGVRPWYEAKKARDEQDSRRVVVAVMRKLALALYQVGVHGQQFRPQQLFGRVRVRGAGPARPRAETRRQFAAKGG
jgi:hypothetical protein